jgi:hypothetical protein
MKAKLVGVLAMAVVLGVAWAAEESERAVEAREVPPPALQALERLAGPATIDAFAEEVEHGRTFYEGSWQGASGRTDALVTPAGDVVEVEEAIPESSVPAPVMAELRRAAGEADVKVERKTLYVYEGHFDRHGKEQEIQFTPDGRRYLEPRGR